MIRTEQIDAGRVKGLVTHAEKPRAGVLLLCTITGVDAFMRERGQRLAEAGYSSLVWDPYPGEPLPQDLPSAQAQAKKLNDGVVDEMSECVGYMLGTMQLPAVAVVGFCLGGRYALLLGGRDKRLFACVPYYPSVHVPNQPQQTLDAVALSAAIPYPVHLIHAGADQVFKPEAFALVRAALEQRPVATIVEIHPGAVHSFMRPDLQNVPANASGSRLSWPQVVAFLDASLAQRMAA
ncbi:MAG: dienelactone hydrolase family protein [Xanthobacteraceae bacterium]|nr:dienelactone hydrolase family protein [Xanthobacteraceae bacterium]